VTLALGIGANVAAVTVVRAVWLNPLPYPHPEQLVRLFDDRRGSNSRGDGDAADSVDIVAQELAAMGRRGEIVADARERTLALLRNNDACAEWFQESNPDTAEVFRSLHYTIEDAQPSYTLRKRDARNLPLLKHPWAAHAIQYGGRKSTINLNVTGPFFRTMSPVHDVGPLWLIGHPLDHTQLGVASFRGDTAAAQITILLHELGHVVGRLPLDSDSWDGQSSRNTVEVLRHCKPDIHEVAQKNWQRGN
jgi:hypothetical protein